MWRIMRMGKVGGRVDKCIERLVYRRNVWFYKEGV